jgi:hypothetical protein
MNLHDRFPREQPVLLEDQRDVFLLHFRRQIEEFLDVLLPTLIRNAPQPEVVVAFLRGI